MRGEHDLVHVVVAAHFGIIPACAGSTARIFSALSILSGSSPHARGARLRIRPSQRSGGDHPRMRGEHLGGLLVIDNLGGIIPACAGRTW